MPVRAFLKIGALALILSQVHPQRAAAQVVESDAHVTFGCPSSDLVTSAEIRRGIDKSLDYSLKYPSMFAHDFELIRLETLPKLLIVSDRMNDLGMLWGKRAIENPADLNTAFHYALSTKNASLMRSVASSNVRRTRTQSPFLAPTAELPALAAVYAKLFERELDLFAEYRKLAESAWAEAKLVGPAPAGMKEEGPEHRRRLAAAWMLVHLERIRMQIYGPGNMGPAPQVFLDRAAALVSRECQPQTWRMIQSLRSGKPVCSDKIRDDQLLVDEHPYVCKLIDPMGARQWKVSRTSS